MTSAIAQLAAARPELDDRRRPAAGGARRLEVRWAREADDDDPLAMYVERALSQRDDDAVHAGWYESPWEGRFEIVVRSGVGAPPPEALAAACVGVAGGAFEAILDRGDGPDGPARWSYFVHGADLRELARAGVRLSPAAARQLLAAARAPLEALHAAGWLHGALTPARIRLALAPDPYLLDLGPAPIRFCGVRGARYDPDGAARELAVLAAAVAALAPGGLASAGPDADAPAIHDELVGLWREVARRCGERCGVEHRVAT